MKHERDYADRLRQEIDHGKSGDKVNFMDPAAAPLGTDDEAAGTPPTAEQVRLARAFEVRARPQDASAGRPDRTIAQSQTNSVGWIVPALVSAAIMTVLLYLAYASL